MKVSLIGSDSTLAKQLIDDAADDVVLQCFGNSKPDGLKRGSFTPFRLPDNPINYDQLLDQDLVVYAAAAGVQSNKSYLRSVVHEVNFLEPIRVRMKLEASDFKGTMITFGTYFELGESKLREPVTEEQILSHSNTYPNDYCLVKNLYSRYVNYVMPKDRLRHLHLILPNLYGAVEPEHRLIPYLVKCFGSNRSTDLSSGVQFRQYLHLSDLSQFIYRMAEKDEVRGLYNLTYPIGGTIKSIVQAVVHNFPEFDRKSLNFGSVSKRDESMSYLALDDKRARLELGWNPRISLNEGIKSYLDR